MNNLTFMMQSPLTCTSFLIGQIDFIVNTVNYSLVFDIPIHRNDHEFVYVSKLSWLFLHKSLKSLQRKFA